MLGDDDGSSHSDAGLGAWSDDEQLLPADPAPLLPVPASRPSTAAALIHGTEDLPPACQAVLRRTASALDASITILPGAAHGPQPTWRLQPTTTDALPERPKTRAQADESDFVSYVYKETASVDFYKPDGSTASTADVLYLEGTNELPACPAQQGPARAAASVPPRSGRPPELATRQASNSSQRPCTNGMATAQSDLSALPTITFPLAAGLSSLSRRRSSCAAKSRRLLLLATNSAAAEIKMLGEGAAASADAASSAPADAHLAVVRQLLLQRRPDMLQDLEAALAGNQLHSGDE